MRSKWREGPYRRLIGKLLWHTALLMLCALATVLILSKLGQGIIGGVFASLIKSLYGVNNTISMDLYNSFVRENMGYIVGGATVILFFILFRLQLGWFTKYFDEIISGMDIIAKGSSDNIVMSPELDFISDKLSDMRYQLMRSAQAEKEAALRKNDLVVYLAHDIKTPLTSVIGYLSLMDEDRTMSIIKREEYTNIALEKAYRLEGLIEEFFDITRYNLSDIPINKTDIDLGYMLVQLVDEAYPELCKSGKEVDIDIESDVIICGDSDKMARVFNNLLKNAIAYGEDNSTIQIKVTRYGKGIFITVKSKGEISEDKLDRIFDKFYRMDKARQTTTGGAGLGLAIARDIITLHGGTIKAKNEDGFTVFTMFLPEAVENNLQS